MRIEQIEIKNYRSFRHAVFEDFTPDGRRRGRKWNGQVNAL